MFGKKLNLVYSRSIIHSELEMVQYSLLRDYLSIYHFDILAILYALIKHNVIVE